MGFLGIQTEKERAHEKDIEQIRANQKNQAIQAQIQAQAESDEKNRLARERSEDKDRASNERIAKMKTDAEIAKAETEKYAIGEDVKVKIETAKIQENIEANEQKEITKRQQQELEQTTKQTAIHEEGENTRAKIQENINAKGEEEKTKRQQHELEQTTAQAAIREEGENTRAKIQENISAKKEEEDTNRTKINADRDVAISESESRVKEKAISEISNMFESYLKYTTESHKAEIELLYKSIEIQKEKFFKLLEKNQSEKEKLMELSARTANGVDKMDYQTRIDDLEATIKKIIEEDAESDKKLKSTLAQISYRQRIETQKSNEKMISMNSLFLTQQDAPLELGEEK